jgi:CPA2 family monovalent cation:H+ antiporter-2
MAESAPHDVSWLFLELGAAMVGLAILARLANRFGFSAIPLYLLAGLAFGTGGIEPLNVSKGFVEIGAEIGVLLLLFMLGLEYSGEELKRNLKKGFSSGLVDLALNFPPGLAAGWLLGWSPLAAVLLGGVTYISSSSVIAKVLSDIGRLDCPETPGVMSVLVLEDLAMAIYLPVIAVLLIGGGAADMAIRVSIAVATVGVVLFIAIRFGEPLSRFVSHQSDEIVLLTTFGIVLLVSGLAQQMKVSAAIGAFLVGVAASGPLAEKSKQLLSPLRDLCAAAFFFFFGLQIDPVTLLPHITVALALGFVTAFTKVLTGYWSAGRAGLGTRSRLRAGVALIARGEFSIVIAGLGASLEPQLGPIAAAYVLFLAIVSPLVARFVK